MAPRKYQDVSGAGNATRTSDMPNKAIGPIWSAFLKFAATAAVPITLAVFAWSRNVEARIAQHDVVFSAMQTDRLNLRQTLDEVRQQLRDMDVRLRDMQISIATLTSQKHVSIDEYPNPRTNQ